MPSMSSLSVFHGLQSCLDSQTNPDDIIKLQQLHRWPRPVWFFTENQASEENRASFHGLKSVNFLNNPVTDIDPLPSIYAKQTLSTNSNLDMCTETLGCETGAMCSGYELEIGSLKKRKKKKNPTPRSATPPEFPPPLTTLSGEGRLRLGRKREKGRLLLIPFKPFAVESERSGGRLLLRILPAKEMEGGGGEEGKEKLGGEDEDEDGFDDMGCFGNGGGGKYRRSGRCNKGEGGRPAAIFNCDSFLVASS
ncbi:hypothetical protein IEQ34_005633 [Dendrobium chrysotoxum]|uniref:FAF domain-containing protein n=1 Tax=Dendrobium chrysotoxum TaxID=161865 RepID=A0AAV7HDK4_DENCH|nr:hypothetical protein IEQ34_005633 [Dendrobium chrysotoxum]